MKFKVSIESLVLLLKYSLSLIMCWPPPLKASKSDLIIHDVQLLIVTVFPIFDLLPITYTMFYREGDVAEATQVLTALVAITFALFKMFMCRYYRDEFRKFIARMEDFIKNANPREKLILEEYMDKFGPLYVFVAIASYFVSIVFNCGPLILPMDFPGDLRFPFQMDAWLYILMYGVAVLGSLQATAAVFVDYMIALLLWYYGIQFNLLAEDFTMANSLSEFEKCVEKHQELLYSAQELIFAIRYTVLGVVVLSTAGNLCTGYQLITHQPIAVLAQFAFMLLVICMEVLMYAWPANNLMTASEDIGYAVYSSNWLEMTPKMLSSLRIVMLRSQKPLVIYIDGILPVLNLDFYGKFLTTSFSYFTTLRAMTG